MWKTVVLLIATVLVLPFLAFQMDVPLTNLQKDSLTDLLWIYVFAASICFLISTLTKNHSQVDKLWSLLPLVYVWLVAIQSGFEPRLVLMAVLISLWGIRLTFNFSRRGGYSIRFWTGEEDYRWSILKSKPEFKANWKWMLFNLLFISFYQMGLILLMTLPALRSMEGGPLSWTDALLAALLLAFLIVETVADQQQWNYHRAKRRLIAEGKPLTEKYQKGFTHTGLWGLVRHPNYAAEQAIWIVFYFFSVAATGQWLNWSLTGCILLVLLFWGSSNFSEEVSASKYPHYADYQSNTPRFIPFLKK